MAERVKREPKNKILTREDEEKILEAYNNGLSPENIRVNVLNSKFKTAKSIVDAFKRLGEYGHRERYFYSKTKNHNYFSEIDTELKAYFLGLMQSDGWIHSKSEKSNQVGLCLAEDYILEKFKQELDSENKIVIRHQRKEHYKALYQLQIDSPFLYKDLLKYGVDDKFKSCYMPILPKKLYNHYLRGLFDGDGCVCIGKTVNNLHVNFLSGIKIASQISFFLSNEIGIYQSQPHLTNNKVGLYEVRYAEKDDVLSIYNYLYKDATFWMKRKREIFEGWFSND